MLFCTEHSSVCRDLVMFSISTLGVNGQVHPFLNPGWSQEEISPFSMWELKYLHCCKGYKVHELIMCVFCWIQCASGHCCTITGNRSAQSLPRAHRGSTCTQSGVLESAYSTLFTWNHKFGTLQLLHRFSKELWVQTIYLTVSELEPLFVVTPFNPGPHVS